MVANFCTTYAPVNWLCTEPAALPFNPNMERLRTSSAMTLINLLDTLLSMYAALLASGKVFGKDVWRACILCTTQALSLPGQHPQICRHSKAILRYFDD